jgi:hypothetical protein
MPKNTIKISSQDGNLKVDKNLVKLSLSGKDTVTWDIAIDADQSVEILFYPECNLVGPFKSKPSLANPGRGWYKSVGASSVDSNDIDAAAGTIWKYDIVLYDAETGQEIDRKDPWVKIGG